MPSKDRIEAAAAYVGIKGGFDGFRARIMDLRAELAIPANLTALGVKAADLDMLTDMALEDPSCGGNPVEMTRENTRALFDACMSWIPNAATMSNGTWTPPL
jgi:alcohol dehydrogenase class IV